MFKKHAIAMIMVCISLFTMAQTKKNPFYYELIANESKSTNFVFGFYPSTYNYVEGAQVDPYSSYKGAVINNATGSLKWNDYKIMILLKSGDLVRSYTTVAETGDYDCDYTVAGSETHYQYFCFHKKFNADEISKVWLVLGDDQIFNLIYDKNE